MEAAAPRLVAEDDDLLATVIFLLIKSAAHKWRDTERRENAGREARRVDLRWGTETGEFIIGRSVTAQVGKCMSVTDICANPGSCDTRRIAAIIHAFNSIAECDEPGRVRKWQGS